MRVAYMVGGFSSTDALVLSKLIQHVSEVCVIYTRPQPAAYDVLERANVKWIDVGRMRRLPKFARWSVFALETIGTLRRLQPDAVIAQGIQGHGLMAVLSRVRPVLLMPWGSDWAIVANRSRLMRSLSSFVVRHVDLVQIDCNAGKNIILDLGGDRIGHEDIWVFPRGIELQTFKSLPEARKTLRKYLGWQDKKIFVMTRRLLPVYGVDVFLEAVSLLADEEPQMRVMLVGDGPERGRLERLSISLGLRGVVRFVGRVRREDLVNYLSAADAYVSTSYSDGTSLSLLEAMAVGLPVVATDVPSNLEWISDGYNGFIAKRGDPRSVRNALSRLLHSEDLWPVFAERNRAIARERADWDRNFSKFLMMLALMQRRRGRSLPD